MSLFTEVDGYRATAQRVGNLAASALPAPSGEDPRHWQNGLSWRSELCPAFEVYDPCGDLTTVPDTGNDGIVYYRPQAYRVRDYCTTLNVSFDEMRVQRRAEAVASYAAAQELWTGAATKADPYVSPASADPSVADQTNPYLASAEAEVITTTVSSAMEGLALLEQATRAIIGGQQAFLHVPIRVARLLSVRRVGNLLMTPTDAIVVADPGYPGTGPDGTAPSTGMWCYGTGPVTLRMSDIAVTTEPTSVVVNRQINRREVWADRMFAATFDPCALVALTIS